MLDAAWLAKFGKGFAPNVDLASASGIAFHSDRVQAGHAFFALPGDNSHGINFADKALDLGASYIVSDRPHPKGIHIPDPAGTLLRLGQWFRKNFTGPVIAVTGSSGKTTTKTMLAAALDMPSSPGNFNTPLALATTLVNTLLPEISPKGLVLELGIDHKGEMAKLIDLVKPSHGIITLIAASHLEGFENLETVAQEKSLLLEKVSHGFASLDAYEHLSHELKEKVKTYGFTPQKANYQASFSFNAPHHTLLRYKDQTLTLPFVGEALAKNALISIALADYLNIPLDAAKTRLEAVKLEPSRLQTIMVGDAIILDDSYNSNPASAREALKVLQSLPSPHTAILGDMLELGSDSAFYHKQLGEESRQFDKVIAIGKHAKYIQETNPKVQYFNTIAEAIKSLDSLTLRGTILVKASRGMRFENIVSTLSQKRDLT